MKALLVILCLCALTALVGCAGHPSESDAQSVLQTRIQQQSSGLIRLVSFRKTDGVAQEEAGVKTYQLKYAADIEFTEDCMWGGFAPVTGDWDGSFGAVRGAPQNGLDAFNPAFLGKRKAGRGQRTQVSGVINFEKTENGWHPE